MVELASEGYLGIPNYSNFYLLLLSQNTIITIADDYYRPEWELWRFNITFDDFWPLINEFNTVPNTIQTYNDFCNNFKGIARDIKNIDDFRKALDYYRKTQLYYWRTSLDNMFQEVGISYRRIPTGLWNDLLNLILQDPLVKPVDELGWQLPVSLQELIEVL
jgi:hypothetical protein